MTNEVIRKEIQKLEAEITAHTTAIAAHRTAIDENEAYLCSLLLRLPDEPYPAMEARILTPLEESLTLGSGEPPVEGATPALTYRDGNGVLRIHWCKLRLGSGWVYTPVADGWAVVKHMPSSEG